MPPQQRTMWKENRGTKEQEGIMTRDGEVRTARISERGEGLAGHGRGPGHFQWRL